MHEMHSSGCGGSTRILYLIFSHDSQGQIVRLASAIRNLSPYAEIAIHHDPSKAPLDVALLQQVRGVRVVPNPVKGEWGDFSLVEQYLHAMRWCRDNVAFDWMCTLTGLSYPISPLRAFEEQLAHSGYDGFVRHFDAFDPGPYPKGVWPKGTGETRYLFRYFKLPQFPHYYRLPNWIKVLLRAMQKRLNESNSLFRVVPMPRGARTRIGLRRRRLPFPREFVLCGGRQMLNVNRRALDRIFAYLEAHPDYERYFRRTLIPDEGFFNSILANDRDLRICNDVQRFIKWPIGIGAASVAVITKDEVQAVVQSGAPFALKFDMRVDPEALDLVDSLLGVETVSGRVSLPKTATF